MGLTYSQTGIIVTSMSAAVIGIVCVAIVVFKGDLPFTFSRRNHPCNAQDLEASCEYTEGEFEKYGELSIAPDKKPTVVAMDIVMRILLVTGLPGKATASDSSGRICSTSKKSIELASISKSGSAPCLSLNLSRLTSLTPSQQVDSLMTQDASVVADTEAQLSEQALAAERRVINDMRQAIQQLKAQRTQADESVQAANEEADIVVAKDNVVVEFDEFNIRMRE